MNKFEKLREKLFTLYASNIKEIFEHEKWKLGYEDILGKIIEIYEFYYCPICGMPFLKESLNQDSPNPLTIEDVPPKKLGGKKLLLTCKECNNNLGGQKLDSKLIWDFNTRPFIERKPNSQIEVYYNLNERAQTRGKLKFIDEGKYRIDFGPNIHFKLQEELNFMKDNWNGSKINFKIQTPNIQQVNLALLRVAYLEMVVHFGFGYFFNPSSHIIRQQLQNPDKPIISDFGIPNFKSFPLDNRGIYFIKEPEELRSFMVVFDIKNKDQIRTCCVIMPGPEEKNLEIYSKMKDMKELKVAFDLLLNFNDFVFQRDTFAYNRTWLSYKQNKL